ncbi:hypothetical protein SISSUDRAFT_1047635 [Sistotremastrum suecicum HHB10207 ss-3]|uniref:Uncharacterized protein n=1 Tax=Sistotremastrum suecicum HHB10207 ss-3 TaxID=1314776 RepID=A0A166D1E9_9AGAM|nr:hypothetical protein SISSUDRAFT_1047635 [Sistotremastrum suecicum HHB10207 ss-3]
MKLTCPPTFDTKLLKIRYALESKIVFPGLGNTFKIACSPGPISSGVYYNSYVVQDGQIEGQLDLPPTYWDVVDGDDDDDYNGKK